MTHRYRSTVLLISMVDEGFGTAWGEVGSVLG